MPSNKFVKANGFPTLYGYNCGYGKSELVTLPNGETCQVSLMPDSNSLDLKTFTVWEQFYWWDYDSEEECMKEAENAYLLLVDKLTNGKC